MKHIVIVSQYFWPENFKGNDIAVDLVKRGYKVTVLTGKPNYPAGKFYKGYSFFGKPNETYKGVNVIRVSLIPRGNNGLTLILNYLSFIFFGCFGVLFRIHGKIDAIFVQQLSPVTIALPGILLKKLKKAPLILWVLDLWPESITATTNINNKLILNLLNKLVSYIYKQSDKILISSKNFKDSVLNKLQNESKEILYFPNWAEDVFDKSDIVVELPELPDAANKFKIMYAGNIGDAQDFNSIVSAVEATKHKNINWYIVGNGRKKQWLETIKIEKNLSKLFLLGQYPIEKMPGLFQKADVMLVALKDEPIFKLTVPAKIQSYLASGKMILGMLNGEGAEIIEESGAGLTCKAGDWKLLAKNAIDLSQLNKSETQNKEKLAKKYYFKNFERKRMLDFLENIIIKL